MNSVKIGHLLFLLPLCFSGKRWAMTLFGKNGGMVARASGHVVPSLARSIHSEYGGC